MTATKTVRPVGAKIDRGSGRGGKPARKPAGGTTATGSKGVTGRKSSFLAKVSVNVADEIRGFGEIISLGDVAECFNVTSPTVRKWIASNYLPEGFFPEGCTDRKLYVKTSDVVSSIRAAIANMAG